MCTPTCWCTSKFHHTQYAACSWCAQYKIDANQPSHQPGWSFLAGPSLADHSQEPQHLLRLTHGPLGGPAPAAGRAAPVLFLLAPSFGKLQALGPAVPSAQVGSISAPSPHNPAGARTTVRALRSVLRTQQRETAPGDSQPSSVGQPPTPHLSSRAGFLPAKPTPSSTFHHYTLPYSRHCHLTTLHSTQTLLVSLCILPFGLWSIPRSLCRSKISFFRFHLFVDKPPPTVGFPVRTTIRSRFQSQSESNARENGTRNGRRNTNFLRRLFCRSIRRSRNFNESVSSHHHRPCDFQLGLSKAASTPSPGLIHRIDVHYGSSFYLPLPSTPPSTYRPHSTTTDQLCDDVFSIHISTTGPSAPWSTAIAISAPSPICSFTLKSQASPFDMY